METIIHLLGIVVAVLFFINKVLYLMGKKAGWGIGIVAAVLAIAYLIMLELYILTAVEIGLIIFMVYGHITHDKEATSQQNFNRLLIVALTIIGLLTFRGEETILEWCGSLMMVMGVALLAKKNLSWGWILLSLSHFVFAYITYPKGQTFFADFQVASGIVGLIAWWYLSNPMRSAPGDASFFGQTLPIPSPYHICNKSGHSMIDFARSIPGKVIVHCKL